MSFKEMMAVYYKNQSNLIFRIKLIRSYTVLITYM